MYAADDGDLPNIASSSSGGLNSGFETVSPARVLHSVSPRSRSSGDGGLGTYAGGQSSAHGGDCSPVFSEGREQNLEMFEETNLGHNRSPRVAGKLTERITKNIDGDDLTVESSASSGTPSPSKVKIEPKELVPFLTSFHPNGQPKFNLVSRRSNGRLTKFKVPVPIEERRTVLQSYRSDGKLCISLAKYSDQEEEEQRKDDTSGSKGEE